MARDRSRPALLDRLGAWLAHRPEDRDELVEILRASQGRDLLDADALAMIEGVLQVSEMQARDIMVPRAQMDVIDIRESPDQFIPMVIQTGHSRFPVIGENKDDILGILLAKDLLRHYAGEEEFDVREMLRPAVFIPESKPLNVLLKEFRKNRNHIAIVVDEYGGVAGMVTMEDVIEQIVGDIEDEYDFDDVEDNIVQEKGGHYRVKGLTEIADFNAVFGTRLSEEGHDTIGGLVMSRFARVPKRGEQVSIENLTFKVLRADARRLHLLEVAKKNQ
ncbi:MAG: CBS domain-containing protein [Burkholderiales bacterium]|nr:CBS domain-containing protein [Burkholderiales bacterium]